MKDGYRWCACFYPQFDLDFACSLAGAFQLGLNARLSKLSTGYSSIFKIVTALSTNAPYLLLDEPVLGLDANHRDLFYKTLLAKYSEQPFTVVLSTHLIEEVSHLIEEVVILHHGQVLAKGPREELLSDGYAVSGPRGVVEAYLPGKRVLGVDTLGGLMSASILGRPDRAALPQGLELGGLDLQRLFILMTSDPEPAVAGSPKTGGGEV